MRINTVAVWLQASSSWTLALRACSSDEGPFFRKACFILFCYVLLAGVTHEAIMTVSWNSLKELDGYEMYINVPCGKEKTANLGGSLY